MDQGLQDERAEIIDAIHAWHRGEPLTDRQRSLIEDVQIMCLARAHGLDLAPRMRPIPS